MYRCGGFGDATAPCPKVAPSATNVNGYAFRDATGACVPWVASGGTIGLSPMAVLSSPIVWAVGGVVLLLMFGGKR